MVRICACDDERSCLDTVAAFLKKYFAQSSGEYALTTFADGADLLAGYRPVYDIIFLDIEMARLNGMETARRLRDIDGNVVIIFLTRMAKYAVMGYEVNAFDFIVKPIDYPSFKIKLKKAIAMADMRQEHKIEIGTDDKRLWLPVSAIYYIDVLKHYLTYHTALGVFTARGTLNELAASLRDKCFAPCSRYCLVNLRHVIGIYGDYILIDGERLEISRRKKKELMDAVMDYHGGGRHA